MKWESSEMPRLERIDQKEAEIDTKNQQMDDEQIITPFQNLIFMKQEKRPKETWRFKDSEVQTVVFSFVPDIKTSKLWEESELIEQLETLKESKYREKVTKIRV